MKTLTKKQIDLWVQKLRSGKIKQARNEWVTQNGRFCCLTVLNEKVRRRNPLLRGEVQGIQFVNEYEKLDKLLRNTFGAGIQYFVGLNDNKELSFSQIADIIEEKRKV
jgi:hypothetical protein